MKTILLFLFITLFTDFLMSGTTGKLTGFVKDAETGEALIGCNIILTDTDLGTASDLNGEYFILNIPPGKCSVRFQMIGYGIVITVNVYVAID